ncbi:MAG: L-serine ammonia-lyase [Clostridia bacterium]|nr:L-serine ammonia-lyase [Clostridia bacterium]
MLNDVYSKKITELREKNNMSMSGLADRVNTDEQTVLSWENGESVPSAESFYKMAKVFSVSMDIFFESEEEKKTVEKLQGMESLNQLYRIGCGPSSSHTMGPEKACILFKEKNSDADNFKAILYGSLAKTGKGHCTDSVIINTLAPIPCEVEFDYLKNDIEHPNTMDLYAFKDGEQTDFIRVFSVGGGRIEFEGSKSATEPIVYNLSTFKDIKAYCKEKKYRLWQYVDEVEGEYIWDYLATVWKTMKEAVERGIEDEGILPGGLEVQKKAKYLYNMEHIGESAETRENREVCSYAFAVSEQNASGNRIVTAPTCGASGVVPAVLYYMQHKHGFTDEKILKALATAGLIGNLVKTNASISGAECGCQAEVGTACAMAATALGELFGLKRGKIEYAAEIAIEHHLGLTCDPICGLVQIPCIERNAVAAMRAINAVNLASFLSETRKISLDNVIETMKKTGLDIHAAYRETSEGGLATLEI